GGHAAADAIAGRRRPAPRKLARHAWDQPTDADLPCSRRLLPAGGVALGLPVARARDRHDIGTTLLARLLEAWIHRRQHLARSDQPGPDSDNQVVDGGLLEIRADAIETLLGELVAFLVERLV